jgi:hypothetical protein
VSASHPSEESFLELPEHLESVVERFEAAWAAGDRPNLADYLPAGAERFPLLVELIRADMEWRFRGGESVRLGSYLRCFPELRERPRALACLQRAEKRCRQERDEQAAAVDPDTLTLTPTPPPAADPPRVAVWA